MKKTALVILIIVALTHSVIAQTNNMQIAYIDKIREQIKNNISKFQKIDSTKGSWGYRYVYANNGELKFIVVEDTVQNIGKHVEWYFSNGEELYAEQLWTDNKGKVVDNEKFYFKNKHLINWVKSNGVIADTTSKEFADVETQLLAYSYKVLDSYSNK